MSLANLPVHATLTLLVLMSLATWAIGIAKVRHFRKMIQLGAAFQEKFWQAPDVSSGEAIAKQAQGDFAVIAQTGYAALAEYQSNPNSLKFYGEVNDVLQRPMRQSLATILRQQEKGLAVLGTIGSTAPFVGLFGTVWGIMDALKAIGLSGQASIDIVAGPIGEALIATAVGILTAIPAVMLYNYFVRKLKVRTTELDGFVEDFLRVISKHIADDRRIA